MSILDAAVPALTLLAQPAPDPEDVKPGWLGFGVFLLLAAAVVVLAFSFVKQLRKAKQHFDAEAAAEAERQEPGAEPNGDGNAATGH